MLRFKRSTEVPQIDRRQRDYVLLFNIYSISSLSWLLKRLFFLLFLCFLLPFYRLLLSSCICQLLIKFMMMMLYFVDIHIIQLAWLDVDQCLSD